MKRRLSPSVIGVLVVVFLGMVWLLPSVRNSDWPLRSRSHSVCHSSRMQSDMSVESAAMADHAGAWALDDVPVRFIACVTNMKERIRLMLLQYVYFLVFPEQATKDAVERDDGKTLFRMMSCWGIPYTTRKRCFNGLLEVYPSGFSSDEMFTNSGAERICARFPSSLEYPYSHIDQIILSPAIVKGEPNKSIESIVLDPSSSELCRYVALTVLTRKGYETILTPSYLDELVSNVNPETTRVMMRNYLRGVRRYDDMERGKAGE